MDMESSKRAGNGAAPAPAEDASAPAPAPAGPWRRGWRAAVWRRVHVALVLVTLAVLWTLVESHTTCRRLYYGRGPTKQLLLTRLGAVEYWHQTEPEGAHGFPGGWDLDSCPTAEDSDFDRWKAYAPEDGLGFLGFAFRRGHYSHPSVAARVPLWAVALLTGAAPARACWRYLRRRRRWARGRCMGCGYDLRATAGGRCPECGAPTPATMPARAGEAMRQ